MILVQTIGTCTTCIQNSLSLQLQSPVRKTAYTGWQNTAQEPHLAKCGSCAKFCQPVF